MQAITLSPEGRGPGAAARKAFDDELMARLGPLVDMFTNEERDRMDQGLSPLVFWLLDADGLPTGGMIFDEQTGRRTRFRLPITGKAVA